MTFLSGLSQFLNTKKYAKSTISFSQTSLKVGEPFRKIKCTIYKITFPSFEKSFAKGKKKIIYIYKHIITYSNIQQCCIQMLFGHAVFFKLRVGQFSDAQKPPMVVAEFPKLFDVQCIWGRIFASLQNVFVFKYSQTIFH